jgi:hypothetical protein
MSWNDVADVIARMTDQPADSDLYLRPAVKILAEIFPRNARTALPHTARASRRELQHHL